MKREVHEVRQTVTAAFSAVGVPKKVAPEGPERAMLDRVLRGKEWNRLTRPEIARLNDCLLLLTPRAFRYYLPAFIMAALDELESGETPGGIAQVVIFALTPRAGRSEAFDDRVSGLTVPQRRAISQFLEIMDRHGRWLVSDAAEAALSGFWGNAP